MKFSAPRKPSDHAELSLVHAILDGDFPPGSSLPAERELATMLGITRPTLREALGRLDRDGWITIKHGKPTQVRDYWTDGGLNVLAAMIRSGRPLSPDFVSKLLEVRLVLAPAYARTAVENEPQVLLALLEEGLQIPDSAQAFSVFDWRVHRQCCISSQNPVFTLILNGFHDLYAQLGAVYFQSPETRQLSRQFYMGFHQKILEKDVEAAVAIVTMAMQQSLDIWNQFKGASS